MNRSINKETNPFRLRWTRILMLSALLSAVGFAGATEYYSRNMQNPDPVSNENRETSNTKPEMETTYRGPGAWVWHDIYIYSTHLRGHYSEVSSTCWLCAPPIDWTLKPTPEDFCRAFRPIQPITLFSRIAHDFASGHRPGFCRPGHSSPVWK